MGMENINNSGCNKIDIEERININNCSQYISIKGNDINYPLLLVLHGGPGDASLPLVRKYNKRLEEHFNVVVWEQRGCGKSYYKFTKSNPVHMNMFVDDIYQIVKILLNRFHRKKLFLTAHSWGSVLGLKFIEQHAQLIYAYIGCGQVVNMRKNARISYEFALQNTTDQRILQKLKKADWTCSKENWYQDLMLITKQVIKHNGSLYGCNNYNKLISVFLKSKEYSKIDLMKRTLGSVQSIKFLWQELLDFNMEDTLSFDTPVIFLEGRHDYHVSSEVAYDYYQKISTEKSFVWFENSAHFPQWEEAEKYHTFMVQLKHKMDISS